MRMRWLAMTCAALAGAGIVASGPAVARTKYRVPLQCVERPQELSLFSIWFNTRPLPNGCAPPVFFNGQYVGQDPDPRIRQYLRHDPQSGYDGPQ